MAQSTAVRQVQGRELPAAGTWVIDPAHTSVEAIARHLMVTKVRGTFLVREGRLVVSEDPAQSSVHVVIDAASVDTREPKRDEHLRSADWLDVQNYPDIEFVSTSLEAQDDAFLVHGDLTLHGVTRPVTLKAEFGGVVQDPWGGQRALFSAATELDREDFGLTWNMAMESAGVLVSKKVRIELDVQAVLEK